MESYAEKAKLIRILGEPVRLAILDMISCGEICACEILEGLTITQSTLSHHMGVLIRAEVVSARKDATSVYYSINSERTRELHEILDSILLPKQNCVCLATKPCGEK